MTFQKNGELAAHLDALLGAEDMTRILLQTAHGRNTHDSYFEVCKFIEAANDHAGNADVRIELQLKWSKARRHRHTFLQSLEQS